MADTPVEIDGALVAFDPLLLKGDAGATGATGLSGAVGATTNLTMGSVSMGASPSASLTGTAPNQVLNLVLPIATGSSAPIDYDVRTYGALCNGITNDSAAVAAAAATANLAGSGRVVFPAGVTIAGGIPVYTNVHYAGRGYGATTVRAPAGANGDVFATYQFASLTTSNTDAGPYNWSIRDMTIDANKASNSTGGRCISIYGQNFTLAGLRCINARAEGIWSESWSGTSSSTKGGPESHWYDVKILEAEQKAVNFLGPHDSIWMAVEGINCARTSGDVIFDTTGVKAAMCHAWGTHHATSWIMRASCHLVGCEAEDGSATQVQILGNSQSVTGGRIYAGFSSANSAYGVTIGDGGSNSPTNWRVNTKLDGFGVSAGSAVQYLSDGGYGEMIAQILQSSGTVISGSPASTTTYRYNIDGSGATLPAIAAFTPSLSRFGTAAHSINRLTLASNGPVTVDASAGDWCSVLLEGNATSWVVNNGQTGQILTLEWKQDGTGSRTIAAAPANVFYAAGSAPTWSTAANARDNVSFIFDGSNGNWYETSRAIGT